MKPLRKPFSAVRWIAAAILPLILLPCSPASAAQPWETLPTGAVAAAHYLLDAVGASASADVDIQRIAPLIDFLQTSKPSTARYRAGDGFDAPSAFHQFTVRSTLKRIVDYTLNADIPSFFFWPSSLRLARWTRIDGGDAQLDRLKSAFAGLDEPFTLRGAEHLSITPDQHTGAYYSYDVDKLVVLAPYRTGKLMLSVYRQQKPSMVGRKGWVLGDDDDWNYLYTEDKGLNLKGLGWVDTYMYDSFGISLYYQPDPAQATVICGAISWVRAGWAGINMVKPHHIHRGLLRVAEAFVEILENPRLPDPERLAATFSRSKHLPTPTLKRYGRDYFSSLEQRIAASKALREAVGADFDSQALLDQMSREEIYAVLALDYFKKLLGRDPVMASHPF